MSPTLERNGASRIVKDLWKQITQRGVFSSVQALSPCSGRPTSRTGWSQGDWADSAEIQSQLFFVGLQLFQAVDSSPRTRMRRANTRHRGRESEDTMSWVWRALSQRASPRGTELCRHGAWSRELGGGGGWWRACITVSPWACSDFSAQSFFEDDSNLNFSFTFSKL